MTPYSAGLSRRSSPAERPLEIARTRHHGDWPASPLRGSLAGRLSTLVRLVRGGQTRLLLHLRRQIGSDFHACANFDNDRGIPAHEVNSLSFSPRGSFGSHKREKLAPFACCVTCFECLPNRRPSRTLVRQSALLARLPWAAFSAGSAPCDLERAVCAWPRVRRSRIKNIYTSYLSRASRAELQKNGPKVLKYTSLRAETQHPIPRPPQLLSHELRDGPLRQQAQPGDTQIREDNVKLLSFSVAGVALLASLGAAVAQDAAAGEKVFAKCKICHQIGEGAKNMVGPVLNGVVGRHSGTYRGLSLLRRQ